MIKANSPDTLFLGLSHEELDRLREGHTRELDAREFGVEKKIFLMSLATEEDILMAMIVAGLISPEMAKDALEDANAQEQAISAARH